MEAFFMENTKKIFLELFDNFWSPKWPKMAQNGPKWPMNIFFYIQSIYIVNIYEIEAFFMEITNKIFFELFDIHLSIYLSIYSYMLVIYKLSQVLNSSELLVPKLWSF